ncbi:conserved Plasmodium protein, unknown function [Plasmodium gallinaceum]|uniref:Uncharacterized protein n=1 Tax=Plasmodium gallinaceum TaxID=5849 RepID=A0A1J1GPU0_PLAGA|nr:conserved Plasmodium protein, unknown function [Plasmodium gallinaceum]CRG94310.1 conserved Plasmodium protein, unknown function [Plasmodium gallinaceum]
MNNNSTYNNSIYEKLSNYSNSYTENNDVNSNNDKVKLSVLCRNNTALKDGKMKTEDVFIKNVDNIFELNILNNVNIERSSSDICNYIKTSRINNIIFDDKHKKDEIIDKNIKENRYKKKCLNNYSSSEISHRNMYNHYLFNKSYTYLKSKYVKEKSFDLEKIEKNKVTIHNMVDFKNEINVKNINKHTCKNTCDLRTKKKRISKEKLNAEKSSSEEKDNYLKSNISHNDDYGYNNHVSGLSLYENKNYDSFVEYISESSNNSLNRTEYVSLEKNEPSESKKYTNNSEKNNNSPQDSMKCCGERYSKGNKCTINDNSELMEVDLLINSEKKSHNRRKLIFYNYDDKKKFTEFLMAEIKIETKMYKLILFIFILILLLLSKNISNYIVITRKCYNIYENPIKSIRRILKFIFIALKICYKFCCPLYFYLISFLFIIVLRIFVILNIPIIFLLLYAKFVLRNEESTARLYFIFLFNIYKYFVFQFSYFFKNFTEQIFLSDSLTFISRSVGLAISCMCKVLQKLYNHIIHIFS